MAKQPAGFSGMKTAVNLGRIAAFVNKRYKTNGDEFPVGGIGFFDCINNQEAADQLFDVAKHWLTAKGYGRHGWTD